jgi:hypothetical protein
MNKCNFIDTHQEGKDFTAHMSTTMTIIISQSIFVNISCTKLNTNQTKNVENMNKFYLCCTQSNAFTALLSWNTQLLAAMTWRYTQFYDSMTV